MSNINNIVMLYVKRILKSDWSASVDSFSTAAALVVFSPVFIYLFIYFILAHIIPIDLTTNIFRMENRVRFTSETS